MWSIACHHHLVCHPSCLLCHFLIHNSSRDNRGWSDKGCDGWKVLLLTCGVCRLRPEEIDGIFHDIRVCEVISQVTFYASPQVCSKVLLYATENWWNVLKFPLTSSVTNQNQRKKHSSYCRCNAENSINFWENIFKWSFQVSCISPVIKFLLPFNIVSSTLYWSLLHVAQVKDRGNLFSLKLHDRAWRQPAVACLRSMLLPHALVVCHRGDAGRDVLWVDPWVRT